MIPARSGLRPAGLRGAPDLLGQSLLGSRPIAIDISGTPAKIDANLSAATGDYGGVEGSFATQTDGSARTFAATGHNNRIRKSGTLESAKMLFRHVAGGGGDIGLITSLRIFVATPLRDGDPTKFTLVSISGELAGSLPSVTGWHEFTGLNLACNRGDVLGFVVAASALCYAAKGQDGTTTWGNWGSQYADGDVADGDFTLGTGFANSPGLIGVIDAPKVAVAGNSFTEGMVGNSAAGGDLSMLTDPADWGVSWADVDVTANMMYAAELVNPDLFDYVNVAKIGSAIVHHWGPLAAYHERITSLSPKFVIFEGGYNDVNSNQSPWPAMRAGYEAFAAAMEAASIVPVFMAILPGNSAVGTLTVAKQRMILDRTRCLAKWCHDNGYLYLPAWELLVTGGGSLSWDTALVGTGSHPNKATYHRLGAFIAAHIQAA